MANPIPTIRVKFDRFPDDPRGYKIINLCDFDPKVHVAFDDDSEVRATHMLRQTMQAPAVTPPAGVMTEAKLRAEIERLSGQKPHHKAGRASLEARYAELTAADKYAASTDQELREAIEIKTGKAPASDTKRAGLVAQYDKVMGVK